MEQKQNIRKFGIDISVYQKKLDFSKLRREGVEFVILRAGYTGYGDGVTKCKDSCFERFYEKCKEINMPVGAYWFTCATTYEKGKAEAEWMYNNCLKNKQFEYPIYIDVEDDTKVNYLRKSGVEGIAQGILGFCETMEKLGYYVGIYSGSYWFKKYIKSDLRKKFDVWCAQYGKSQPTIGHGIWQFGGETNLLRSNKIAGLVCDQNYCYRDYPSIMKNKHLNGF